MTPPSHFSHEPCEERMGANLRSKDSQRYRSGPAGEGDPAVTDTIMQPAPRQLPRPRAPSCGRCTWPPKESGHSRKYHGAPVARAAHACTRRGLVMSNEGC